MNSFLFFLYFYYIINDKIDITLSANMTLDTSDVSANNDRRSAHNALERQRREHLNNKFQQLALALPSLQSVRRPSKTMIVAKSLEFGKTFFFISGPINEFEKKSPANLYLKNFFSQFHRVSNEKVNSSAKFKNFVKKMQNCVNKLDFHPPA
jgi:hypothetical protein